MGLTKRQAQALAYIHSSLRDHGVAPSLSEIGRALGLSVNSKGAVHKLLCQLRDRGHIVWATGHKHSIRLIGDTDGAHILPPAMQSKLDAYCAAHNERPDDVIADALTLHFDELEWMGT